MKTQHRREDYTVKEKDDRYNFKMTFHISFVSGASNRAHILPARASINFLLAYQTETIMKDW